MEKEFVTYELAVALKEIGFDGHCLMMYSDKSLHTRGSFGNLWQNNEQGLLAAPLYQQVFRWFREKYGLWFRPDFYDEVREDFSGSIHKLGRFSAIEDVAECKSAEEAELECLKKLIEIVKNEK